MTLTEFLLARIAEDEAEAQDVYRWLGTGSDDFEDRSDRVLNECEAKRRIVELHPILSWTEPGRSLVRHKPMCASCADNENADYDGAPLIDWPCPTLKLLAAVYADHPDYNQAWRQ